jgi:hypothetical protein
MRWRAAVLPLLLLCLSLRAGIPAGWMPMFGPEGVSIMLCPGWDGTASADRHAMAMGGDHADPASHDPDKSSHSNNDRPCAFSVVAGSDPGPSLATVAPPIAVAEAPFMQARTVWADRSPSAPPPPSTGPPIPA